MSWKGDESVHALPDVLSKTLDGEAVLLDLRSGTYFGLNPVGTVVWELIVSGSTVEQIVEGVLKRFEVAREAAERDLQELLGQLEERGLVGRSEGSR